MTLKSRDTRPEAMSKRVAVQCMLVRTYAEKRREERTNDAFPDAANDTSTDENILGHGVREVLIER